MLELRSVWTAGDGHGALRKMLVGHHAGWGGRWANGGLL